MGNYKLTSLTKTLDKIMKQIFMTATSRHMVVGNRQHGRQILSNQSYLPATVRCPDKGKTGDDVYLGLRKVFHLVFYSTIGA